MMDNAWHFQLDLQLFAQEEKTEEATPHRREDVRKKGQVARSQEVSVAGVLLVGILLIFSLRWTAVEFFLGGFDYLGLAGSQAGLSPAQSAHLFSGLLVGGLSFLAPLLGAVVIAGLAANLSQVGFMLSPDLLKFRLEQLNPAEGLKRIFSRRSLLELVKALIKVTIIGLVAYILIRNELGRLLALSYLTPNASYEVTVYLIFRVALWTAAIFGAVAALDLLYQKKQFARRIRMSRPEIKEEQRQIEGDPLLRARLRQQQRAITMNRMMQAVPEASVVITNPTHLAVALQYKSASMPAPRVVAKGTGLIARRIIELARNHNVPVVENRPLVHLLYRRLNPGQEVSSDLYQAVAEVLAMIYRLYGREF